MRSASGFRKARWIVYAGVAALVIAILTSLPAALSADADEYGRISLPGEGVLRLPEGTVDVSYQTSQGVLDNFDEPRVAFEAVELGGDERINKDFGGVLDAVIDFSLSSERTDDYTREWIGSFDVERAGRYRVSASPKDRQRYSDPALVFGTSGGHAVWSAFKIGLIPLGVALVVAFCVAVATAVRRLGQRTAA
jgi:hypothetical protein